ncbi:MAG: aspartate aminotransferase family protein [Lentisphaeria bacterium]|nr:aspartate aminotransferase family protein [Lentisphaeria bacterium]
MQSILDYQAEYLLPTYAANLLLTKGEGAYVWDSKGKKYLDFSTGISVCNLGHCHPKVTKAIQEQAATLVHVSNLYVNEKQPLLAKKLSDYSNGGRVFFANSGAEANEGLIKFARKWGSTRGRHKIITMQNGFHGRTIASLAATQKASIRKGFGPLPEGFIPAPYGHVGCVKGLIDEETAAVLIEPIQGEGGLAISDKAYIQELRKICDEAGILLLFDEVQSAFGRCGYWFSADYFEVQPDACSVAKALGNGFPIGAFIVDRKWEDVLGVSSHGSTFGGTPLACSAALAVLETIEEENLLQYVQEKQDWLKQELENLVEEFAVVESFRGTGFMVGLKLTVPPTETIKAAEKEGLLVIPAGNNVIRFYPPINATEQELTAGIKLLRKALEQTK